MLHDITLAITPAMVKDAQGNEQKALVGHLGTHFDVMNKEFPLAYCKRKGIVFDVHSVKHRDIDICDIAIEEVEKDMFVSIQALSKKQGMEINAIFKNIPNYRMP